MKLLIVLVLLAAATGCTTLENRRDLYDPDMQTYTHPVSTTVVRRTTETTTTTRVKKPALRQTQPEPVESDLSPE